MTPAFDAALLGLIEGLTEFIPVSSTGHLIAFINFLNFHAPEGHVFEVFIQLGAILALILYYSKTLFGIAKTLPTEKKSQNFVLNIIIASIPAVIAGVALHGFIKNNLYNPIVVALALIIGGFVILWIESFKLHEKIKDLGNLKIKTSFMVGCFQMIALIPGVSRSGATIMGSLLVGFSRKAAAELSFFMAMPIMVGAVGYDVYKNWQNLLAYDDWSILVIGFMMAFLAALLVISFALKIIGTYGYKPFAWYRIGFGLLLLYMNGVL